MLIADDLDKLLDILPDFVKKTLYSHPNKKSLIEIVMDLGRRPEARFPDGPEYLSTTHISWYDLDYCIKKIPNFSGDNRSGIESTLHRISSIKNRKGNIIGLTCRVGRAIFGTASMIRDLLYNGQSILLLGKPGVGKTTAIREITRVLADEMEKRVVIIDTSNEIAGDGDIPHPAIGRARRMQVTKPELQHQVMIEAVENHMPEVIIIDEIGTELEVLAARTIAERGVQLVGTAHGNYLESIIKNPTLSDLIGGIQYVTLGDDEAKRRGSQKSVLERKTAPAFQIVVEIHQRNVWIVHEKVDKFVDLILQGSLLCLERRKLHGDGSVSIDYENSNSTGFFYNNNLNSSLNIQNQSKLIDIPNLYSLQNQNFNRFLKNSNSKFFASNSFNINSSSYNFSRNLGLQYRNKGFSKIVLYVYGINVQQVETTINVLKLSITLTRDILRADYILGLRAYIKQNSKIREIAKSKHIVIYTIHKNNTNNIIRALKQIAHYPVLSYSDWIQLCVNKNSQEFFALCEVRYAIEKIVLTYKQSVQLLAQDLSSRNLQRKLINMYNLKYSINSTGTNSILIIYPS
uniref:Ycf45 n=1 Tax=Laurencia catarinensis TaxID=197326 RepID=UPI0028D60772|nr:Ycf45 [Laurencia catarinensis]WMP12499.1 Ycf45 [Laurencia catarinensis]